jgi:2-C-methyl-D-erythritol 4-phosphate cytidylyltransferase
VKTPSIYLVIPAGGKGLRLGGGVPKQFRLFGEKPLLRVTLEAFFVPGMPHLAGVAVAVPADRMAEVRNWELPCPLWVVEGGDSRQDSVRAALSALPDEADARVMIHDGVRPFPPAEPIAQALAALDDFEGSVLGQASTDTLKRVDAEGVIQETLPREVIFRAQTPQIARLALWKQAFLAARRENVQATDDVALLERLGIKVKLIPSPGSNLKITTPEDWTTACGGFTHTPSA